LFIGQIPNKDGVFVLTDFEFQVDNFMLFCSSKNLSRKTLASYEQTLKLFGIYLEQIHGISDVKKVTSAHVRHYVKYLRERGKYTAVINERSKTLNHPDHRHDFNKPLSDTTVANYLRNIKVFFNFLHKEREINRNPVKSIENIKPKRKAKPLLTRGPERHSMASEIG
jgi:integrase/recombinase XerD